MHFPKKLFILAQRGTSKLSQNNDSSKKYLSCARLPILEPCIPPGQMAASQGVGGEFFLVVLFFCNAAALTFYPCPSPLPHQELQGGAAAAVAID